MYAEESNSRLVLNGCHLYKKNQNKTKSSDTAPQLNSIKGNLYCNIFQRPLKKISSKWQHQTANLISSSLTGLLQGCLSSPPLSVCSSDTFLSSFPLSLHLVTLSFSLSRPLFFSLWHSFQHVHSHCPSDDRKSDADKRDRSSDPGWITPVYATELHAASRESTVCTDSSFVT